MGIFDRLIQKETLEDPNVTPKAEAVTLPVGDIESMKQRAALMMSKTTPTTTQTVVENSNSNVASLSEALKAQKREVVEVSPKEEMVIEKVVEPTIVEVAPEPEIFIQPKIEMQEVKPMPEKDIVEILKAETKKDVILNPNKGREFVSAFLSEINIYLEAGKELEKLVKVKEEQKIKTQGELETLKTLEADGNTIREAIQSFLEAHNDEESREKLVSVINTFSEYKNNFNTKKQQMEQAGLKLSNETLVKINAKKAEIAKLVEKFGSQEIIKSMIEYVRRSERVASRYNERNGVISINGAESAINNFIMSDLPGVKMLAQANDITGILMSIFLVQEAPNKFSTNSANDNESKVIMQKAA